MNFLTASPVIPSYKLKSDVYTFGLSLKYSLSTFHGRFVESLEDLPPKGRLKEVAIRILTIIAAPILYPFFGILSITGQILVATGLNRHIRLNVKALSRDIDVLRKGALPGWQQEAMALVRKARYDDPWAELERLKASKVLTEDASRQFDELIRKVNPNIGKKKLDRVKVIMAQALEIKSIYSGTHHVFIHAQASNWLGLIYLVKELHRAFNPDTHMKHFKFLRPPLKLAQPDTISSIWKTVRNAFLDEKKPTNVKEYISAKWFVSDNDGETREHLLSVDGYFFNAQKNESSLFFLVNNANILGKPDTIKYFCKQIISHYRPNLSPKNLNLLVDRVFNAVKSEEAVCGNLFTICVPKEKSEEIQYRAHPYGAVCTCHPAAESKAILEGLQKDSFNPRAKCKVYEGIPQYRIYTPMLEPKVTPTYLLTPYEKTLRKAMKAKIRSVVLEMSTMMRE